MPIELQLPGGWTTQRRGTSVHATPPGEPAPPRIVVDIDPLVPATAMDPSARLALALPPGATLEHVLAHDLATATGWPMRVVHVLVTGAGGQILESRLGAFYRFLVYGGAVVARATDLARWETVRGAVLDAMTSARPRLRAEQPALLADLFAMGPP
jgi:hypothetical protein